MNTNERRLRVVKSAGSSPKQNGPSSRLKQHPASVPAKLTVHPRGRDLEIRNREDDEQPGEIEKPGSNYQDPDGGYIDETEETDREP